MPKKVAKSKDPMTSDEFRRLNPFQSRKGEEVEQTMDWLFYLLREDIACGELKFTCPRGSMARVLEHFRSSSKETQVMRNALDRYIGDSFEVNVNSAVKFFWKLGIFRSGVASGTYHNAKERPTELQMEGVFDSKKDLINKDDVKSIKSNDKVSKAVLIVSIILGILFLLLAFTTTLAWLIILIWIIWVGLVVLIRLGRLSAMLPFWLILIVLFIVTFVIIFLTQSDTKSTTNQSTSTSPQTSSVAQTTVSQLSNDETANCLFKTTDAPKQEPGYVADVFVSSKKDVAVGEKRTPISQNSFKLSDFTLENDANLKQTAYFTLSGDTDRFIPGIQTAIQLCNNITNKTTPSNDLTNFISSPTSSNTGSVENNFSWVQAPKQKGQYRLDGVAKFNGSQWKLVDRLNIEFK